MLSVIYGNESTDNLILNLTVAEKIDRIIPSFPNYLLQNIVQNVVRNKNYIYISLHYTLSVGCML